MTIIQFAWSSRGGDREGAVACGMKWKERGEEERELESKERSSSGVGVKNRTCCVPQAYFHK